MSSTGCFGPSSRRSLCELSRDQTLSEKSSAGALDQRPKPCTRCRPSGASRMTVGLLPRLVVHRLLAPDSFNFQERIMRSPPLERSADCVESKARPATLFVGLWSIRQTRRPSIPKVVTEFPPTAR